MKNILILCLLLPLFSLAQKKKPGNYSYLYPDLLHLPLACIYQKLGGDALETFADKITCKQEATIFLDSVSKTTGKKGLLYKKYAATLAAYLMGISSFGETDAILINPGNVPFSFLDHRGALAFSQEAVVAKFTLNTLRLSADQRALRIVKSSILPALSNFEPLFKIAEIKYFILSIAYGTKDFGTDASPVFETTTIIVSKEVVSKYLAGQMSDKEVMASSLFYNTNRDNHIFRLISF